jgi:hypothetical protein
MRESVRVANELNHHRRCDVRIIAGAAKQSPQACRFPEIAPPRTLPPSLASIRIASERRTAHMALHIDYYASLNSPWTHMGAARIEAMAVAHDASLRIYPVDFGEIFANSGGLPLPRRSPQRQAYSDPHPAEALSFQRSALRPLHHRNSGNHG